MIETVVESIRVSIVTQHRVVILKEVNGERHLPIWIGAYEAEAIAMELQGVTAARPLPYDLMKSLIIDLGGKVERIIVSDLTQDVFYARIVIRHNDQTLEIDSRPSDAIAIAVRTQAPILVDEAVMDRAAVTLGSEDETTEELEEPGAVKSAPGEGDEKLSIFRDFINTLDFDDFDRKKGN